MREPFFAIGWRQLTEEECEQLYLPTPCWLGWESWRIKVGPWEIGFCIREI